MKKRQLRQWIYISVAVAFLLGLVVAQIDNNKLYQTLQQQLQQAGIDLQAEQFSLSPMYLGSIRLNGVHIASKTFELDAKRLFIDLDLAALLTGKTLPQALYLQVANINISQEEKNAWLSLVETSNFKLKRIDISQSEIHFDAQHITLEQVHLDIRDIGKNKNPRIELRAHIGDGRIDAHGYLHLKRGNITKGFARVKLHDIPLSSWQHGTSLDTLNGSMTTHLHKDKTWQSLGHITLQQAHKDIIEVRAKLVGEHDELFHLEDMVINHKQAGALAVSGRCQNTTSCQFDVSSSKLDLAPLMPLLQQQETLDSSLKNIQFRGTWKDGYFSSFGEFSWQDFDYTTYADNQHTIHMDAAKVVFSGLERFKHGDWSLKQLSLISPEKKHTEVAVHHATYKDKQLQLPITLQQTAYWLPIIQMLAYHSENPIPQGEGEIEGSVRLTLTEQEITQANIQLDASQAEIQVGEVFKPKQVPLHLQGEVVWSQDKLPSKATVSLKLADSTLNLEHQHYTWVFSNMDMDFDHLKDVGIVLPAPWQAWYGYIRGSTTLYIPESSIRIKQADVDLIAFGRNKHIINGQIQANHGQWMVENLSWQWGKNQADIFSSKHGYFHIFAQRLDAPSLILLHQLPFFAQGKLRSKALHLPFGTLNKVTAWYKVSDHGLTLHNFKSSFYEGSVSSELVEIAEHDAGIMMQSTLQVGGIHLNKWKWLHKQFDTHLEATLYATLNLQGIFDKTQTLAHWSGDGEISAYNSKWLLAGKNITTDKLSLSMRKRHEFNATFSTKDGQKRGKGKLRIDEHAEISGQYTFGTNTYQLSNTWPHLRYQEITP